MKRPRLCAGRDAQWDGPIAPVRAGFRALSPVRSIKALSRGVRRRPHKAPASVLVTSIACERRLGPTYGLDSVSHPSTAPMDTSPARIVCSNRPDTVGEVLQKTGGRGKDEGVRTDAEERRGLRVVERSEMHSFFPGCQSFVIFGTGGGTFDRWEGPL